MEGLLHDDNGWLINALLMPIQARQLDRRFIGFASRIAEKHLVHFGDVGQMVGGFFRFADAIQVGGVDQAAHLFAERLDQARVIMSQRIDSDAGHPVKIGLALLVKQAAALAVGKGDGQPSIGIHQMRHHAPREKLCE